MTLRLPHALTVSAGIHAILLAIWAVLAVVRHAAPELVEISLVSGKGSGSGQTGAQVQATKPGGRRGTAVRTTKPAARAQVSIATPEFVPVGRKPVRRSGEELMGTGGGEGAGPAGPIMGTGEGGTTRKLKYGELPEYPDWAREQGVQARVLLRCVVLPDGSIDPQVSVSKTSGWRQLDELAIKAARNCLLEPLPPGSPQVRQVILIPFAFQLE